MNFKKLFAVFVIVTALNLIIFNRVFALEEYPMDYTTDIEGMEIFWWNSQGNGTFESVDGILYFDSNGDNFFGLDNLSPDSSYYWEHRIQVVDASPLSEDLDNHGFGFVHANNNIWIHILFFNDGVILTHLDSSNNPVYWHFPHDTSVFTQYKISLEDDWLTFYINDVEELNVRITDTQLTQNQFLAMQVGADFEVYWDYSIYSNVESEVDEYYTADDIEETDSDYPIQGILMDGTSGVLHDFSQNTSEVVKKAIPVSVGIIGSLGIGFWGIKILRALLHV